MSWEDIRLRRKFQILSARPRNRRSEAPSGASGAPGLSPVPSVSLGVVTPLRTTAETTREGVGGVRFSLDLDEGVPGLLISPAEPTEPTPLVVVQHPGTGSKDDPFVAGAARFWARKYGWTCLGLDAPLHG